MFTFSTSLYDKPNCQCSAISALGNLHQQNKAFSDFMPEFKWLINDISGYSNDQLKIDLFFMKPLDKMIQLLIGQNMPFDYLRYVTRLYKLDINVRVAN